MPDIESSRIEVPTSIAEAPVFLAGFAQQLQDELDALAAKLAPLQAQWTGGAGQAYTDVQSLWNSDATALFNPETGVLKQISDAVRTVSDNYDLAEDHNVRSWRTF
ncbi:WXG100 family type VII secretion target [Actinoplanes sp. NPDC049596]|uniref:WXG100 family type VII secretion target n=1 Tax=unclassified Actinoplanes TaxID=2626549 RepID=UPI003447F96E